MFQNAQLFHIAIVVAYKKEYMKKVGIKKLPKVLYKYRDWKAIGAMDIISKSKIYFSSPNNFNDIFDCKFPINNELNNEDFYEKRLYDILMKENPLDKEKSVFKDLNSKYWDNPITAKLINSSYKMPIKKRNPNEFFETYLDVTTGIFSLSSTCDNNLMWGHYAANHTGICIGFLTEYLLDLGADYIGKVNYTNILPKLKSDLLNQENLEQIFFTKETDWKYENEYRIIWRNIKERIVAINPYAIHSIHLGYNIGPDRRIFIDSIKNFLPHIKLYETMKDDNEFTLKFKRI